MTSSPESARPRWSLRRLLLVSTLVAVCCALMLLTTSPGLPMTWDEGTRTPGGVRLRVAPQIRHPDRRGRKKPPGVLVPHAASQGGALVFGGESQSWGGMAKLVWPCADPPTARRHAHASEGMAPNFPQEMPISTWEKKTRKPCVETSFYSLPRCGSRSSEATDTPSRRSTSHWRKSCSILMTKRASPSTRRGEKGSEPFVGT